MNNRNFHGRLGKQMVQHLKLRRSLGVMSLANESTLKKFNRYQKENFPTAKTVTRDMMVGYLKTNTQLHSSSRVNEVIYLRQFCLYLFRQDLKVYIPERSLVPKARPKVAIHIFKEEEIRTLIGLARKLKWKKAPAPYAALIGLLWVTGLRMGEAIRLNLEDIDFNEGILHVRQTKFFKSRLIPLSESTLKALKEYRALRQASCAEPQSPLFMSSRGNRLCKVTLHCVFKQLTAWAGIRNVQGKNPRLHDIRHSFATQTLNDHYQKGKDPNAYLPILATYMGHADGKYTQAYLHVSTQVLQAASERFRNHVDTTMKGGVS